MFCSIFWAAFCEIDIKCYCYTIDFHHHHHHHYHHLDVIQIESRWMKEWIKWGKINQQQSIHFRWIEVTNNCKIAINVFANKCKIQYKKETNKNKSLLISKLAWKVKTNNFIGCSFSYSLLHHLQYAFNINWVALII